MQSQVHAAPKQQNYQKQHQKAIAIHSTSEQQDYLIRMSAGGDEGCRVGTFLLDKKFCQPPFGIELADKRMGNRMGNKETVGH